MPRKKISERNLDFRRTKLTAQVTPGAQASVVAAPDDVQSTSSRVLRKRKLVDTEVAADLEVPVYQKMAAASDAEEGNSVLQSSERCALCSSDFVRPVLICACMHVFCQDCLQRDITRQQAIGRAFVELKGKPVTGLDRSYQLITNIIRHGVDSSTKAAASDVTCPTCDCLLLLPAGGVAKLPSAHFVVSTAPSPGQTRDCEFCVDNDKASATLYCDQCDISLCAACCDRIHSRQRKTAGHKPQDTRCSGGEPTWLFVCCSHPSQTENYWCCGRRMCPECVISKHDGHAARSRDRLLSQIGKHDARFLEQRKRLQQMRTGVVKSKTEVLKKIDQFLSCVDRMTNRINQLRLYGNMSELVSVLAALDSAELTRAAGDEPWNAQCKPMRDLLINQVFTRDRAMPLLEEKGVHYMIFVSKVTVLNGAWYRKALAYTGDPITLLKPGPVIHAPSSDDRKDYYVCSKDVAKTLRKKFGVLPGQPFPKWDCGPVLNEDIYILDVAEINADEEDDIEESDYAAYVYNANYHFQEYFELRFPSGAPMGNIKTCVSELFRRNKLSDYARIFI